MWGVGRGEIEVDGCTSGFQRIPDGQRRCFFVYLLYGIGLATDFGAGFVQETASQGLTLVYEKGDKLMKVIHF